VAAKPCPPLCRFFGVRELVLGGLLLAARGDLRQLRPLVALVLLCTGLSGSAASVAVWVELQRFFRGA
jgi:hypothetical protein